MRRRRDQDGTLAVEAAIVAPVLLVLMLLVVYAGRAASTDADVRSAAARAARQADGNAMGIFVHDDAVVQIAAPPSRPWVGDNQL